MIVFNEFFIMFYILFLFTFILLLLIFLFFYFFNLFRLTVISRAKIGENLVVIIKKKVEGQALFGYMYWDFINNKFYFNYVLFAYFNNVYNYYLKFFKCNEMSFLLSIEDVHYFTYFNNVYFSVFFNFLRKFINDNFFKVSYWFLFFFSFLLFILISTFIYFNYGFAVDSDIIFNIRLLKYGLLLFFYLLLNVYFFFYLQPLNDDFIYDSLFVKLLFFFLNLFNNLPLILNNFFCFLLNFFLFFLFFFKVFYVSFFLFSLLSYSLLILIFRIIYLLSCFLVKNGFENKLIVFFSTYKIVNILSFPTSTILLFLFYKIVWWFYFFFKSVYTLGFVRFLTLVLNYNKLSSYDFGLQVTKNSSLFYFLVSCYWFEDYSLNIRRYLGKTLYESILVKKFEKKNKSK